MKFSILIYKLLSNEMITKILNALRKMNLQEYSVTFICFCIYQEISQKDMRVSWTKSSYQRCSKYEFPFGVTLFLKRAINGIT